MRIYKIFAFNSGLVYVLYAFVDIGKAMLVAECSLLYQTIIFKSVLLKVKQQTVNSLMCV